MLMVLRVIRGKPSIIILMYIVRPSCQQYSVVSMYITKMCMSKALFLQSNAESQLIKQISFAEFVAVSSLICHLYLWGWVQCYSYLQYQRRILESFLFHPINVNQC